MCQLHGGSHGGNIHLSHPEPHNWQHVDSTEEKLSETDATQSSANTQQLITVTHSM